MTAAPKVDVIVTIGAVEPEIRAVRLPNVESVAVTFALEGSNVSLAFDADRFRSFVEQLRRFAESLPKPS
jgi:hypothetical protein